nr:MAG TPA: MAS20 protein import receptor [Caudoviricetes sp.]
MFKFIHKNIPPSFDYLGYALYVDYKKGMRK